MEAAAHSLAPRDVPAHALERLRVAHLIGSSSYSPFFVDIARNLDPSMTVLSVGTLAPPGSLHESLAPLGVETFSLEVRSRRDYPAAILRCARLLRRMRIDVLHTHLVEPSLVGLVAARLARVPVRVMTRHHADAALLSGSRRAVQTDRLLGRFLAPRTVAVSEAARRAMIEIDGVPETRIEVVPLGWDWARIRPARAAEEVRRELGAEAGPILCTVGRLDALKGHDVLLEALAQCDLPASARLLVIGGGPQEELRQKAAQLGWADRCLFLGYRSDVYDLMAASDLVVHPSFSEAQCQVVIEALALACPLVATDVGATADAVVPGRTGWLVPARDAGALASAIGEALADRERARAFGVAGQQRVHEMYPIKRMIEAYDELYRRVRRGRG